MAEEGSHGNRRPLLKNTDKESSTSTEDSDDDSDTPLDLTWNTGEDTHAKEQNKIPMAHASSHVLSKCGKTAEQLNLSWRRRLLHRYEEERKECAASSEAMTERHQQIGEQKDSLPLAASQLPYESLVSTEGGQHSCRLCTYVTNHKGNMAKHVRTHTGEQPFQCSECGGSFTDKSNLIRHIRNRHRRERRFACVHCSESFASQEEFIVHMRIHGEGRRFLCLYCDESYTRMANLVRHTRMHTGERPFSCVHCRKSFAREDCLIRHMSKCGAKKKP